MFYFYFLSAGVSFICVKYLLVRYFEDGHAHVDSCDYADVLDSREEFCFDIVSTQIMF